MEKEVKEVGKAAVMRSFEKRTYAEEGRRDRGKYEGIGNFIRPALGIKIGG